MNTNKPLKILHVVGAMNVGGTETMLMNIYRNIDRDKIQFDFISYSQQDAYYDNEIKKLGGRVIKLNNTQSIKELTNAIKTYGPYEAVHSHTLFHCGIANMAAKLCNIKTRVAHAHTTLDRSDSFARKMYIGTMRTVINTFSTDLLACSKEAGAYLFGNNKINSSKYKYFPNLIDYKKFLEEPTKEVERFKVEEDLQDGLVIGHIGRFMEAKNHKFLLEIMKVIIEKNTNAKLLLVGDGDLRTETEEYAKKLGIYDSVRFVGIRDDMNTMLHSMDVFVFPSIFEGLGLVMLEAQASGLNCVVSEAIQPEAELDIDLVHRLNLSDGAEVWANEILKVAGNKEKNTEKIQKSFETKGYSTNECINKLVDTYKI